MTKEQIAEIEQAAAKYMYYNRPPLEVRNQLDFKYLLSGYSRRIADVNRDNDTNEDKTDRLIDKPSGETRRFIDDNRDNAQNEGVFDGNSSGLSGEARQGTDDKDVNKLSGKTRRAKDILVHFAINDTNNKH